MSARFCSTGLAAIPWPTMFSIASTRVFETSMTCRLKTTKFRQPLPPASTTVVTPRER